LGGAGGGEGRGKGWRTVKSTELQRADAQGGEAVQATWQAAIDGAATTERTVPLLSAAVEVKSTPQASSVYFNESPPPSGPRSPDVASG
jgi:hypothetical protein